MQLIVSLDEQTVASGNIKKQHPPTLSIFYDLMMTGPKVCPNNWQSYAEKIVCSGPPASTHSNLPAVDTNAGHKRIPDYSGQIVAKRI